jgi:hypothetical protein
MRLCSSRHPDDVECSCGLLHVRPAGSCAHAVGCIGMQTCQALSPTWCPHPRPSLHALQRCKPALLASAGRRLMPLAPVSGWITACIICCMQRGLLPWRWTCASELAARWWGQHSRAASYSTQCSSYTTILSDDGMKACLPCPSKPPHARHPPTHTTLLHALQPRQPARLASTGRRLVRPALVSACIPAGSPLMRAGGGWQDEAVLQQAAR